jgi:hypothetical protein
VVAASCDIVAEVLESFSRLQCQLELTDGANVNILGKTLGKKKW